MDKTRIVSRLAALCALAVVALPASVSAAAVDGPFEPNDTLQTAFGPLSPAVGYSAQIENAGDADWYYVYTAGPGTVDLSLVLGSCSPTNPGPTCSNVTARVLNGDGGLVGSTVVNTTGNAQHITFEAPRRWRYTVSLQQSGTGGAAYTLTANSSGGLTSAAPDQPLPPPAPDTPAADLPTVLSRFSARFETSYIGTPRRPRARKITGLTVLGVESGTQIVVRCTKGCAKRYRKTVTARGASRRLGGLPMRLSTDTRFRIEIRRSGFVGRFREYGFASKVPVPRIKTSGCTSPYDFSTIFCAPGTE